MAYTDAISVACKMLGVGADVYWDKDTTKYDKQEPTEKPKPEAKVDLANETQLQEIRKLATQKGSSLSSIIKHYGVAGLPKLTFVMAKDCINQLKTKKDI
jgi:hypothetical protein